MPPPQSTIPSLAWSVFTFSPPGHVSCPLSSGWPSHPGLPPSSHLHSTHYLILHFRMLEMAWKRQPLSTFNTASFCSGLGGKGACEHAHTYDTTFVRLSFWIFPKRQRSRLRMNIQAMVVARTWPSSWNKDLSSWIKIIQEAMLRRSWNCTRGWISTIKAKVVCGKNDAPGFRQGIMQFVIGSTTIHWYLGFCM